MDCSTIFRHVFENDNNYIVHIDSANDLNGAWFLYDKSNHGFVKLNFRFMDSSNLVEERFFDEGFLKVNKDNATFIEKFNRSIATLRNSSMDALPKSILHELSNFVNISQTRAAS